MTNLNYSNLPEDAQKAIQKLTGASHEDLEGKTTDEIGAIKKGAPAPLHKPLRASLKTMLAFLIVIFACWGLIALILFTCAR